MKHKNSLNRKNCLNGVAVVGVLSACFFGAYYALKPSVDLRSEVLYPRDSLLKESAADEGGYKPFVYNQVEAISVAEAFLNTATVEEKVTYIQSSNSSEEALKIYQRLTQNGEPQLVLTEPVTLKNAEKPFHYALETDHPISPLYVVREGGLHRIDLEASVGFNEVSIDDLNTFTTQSAEAVRLLLKPHGNTHKIEKIEGFFPHDAGRIILSLQKGSNLQQELLSLLVSPQPVPVIVDLRLDEQCEPNRYSISALRSQSWILKKK